MKKRNRWMGLLLAAGVLLAAAGCGGGDMNPSDGGQNLTGLPGSEEEETSPTPVDAPEEAVEAADTFFEGIRSRIPEHETSLYRMAWEKDGMTLADTVFLGTKEDAVERIGEVVYIDFSTFAEKNGKEIKTQMLILFDDLVLKFQDVEGVECTREVNDTSYVMYVDASKESLEELADQGLFAFAKGKGGISLDATQAALKEGGYESVKP